MGHSPGRWIEPPFGGINTGQPISWTAVDFLDLNAVYSSLLASRKF